MGIPASGSSSRRKPQPARSLFSATIRSEPRNLGFIRGYTANKKKHPSGCFFLLAASPGFEPRLTESESAVLPLDDEAIINLQKLYITNKTKMQILLLSFL